jgi:hypothetical protein
MMHRNFKLKPTRIRIRIRIRVSLFLIAVVIFSCENTAESAKNTSSKYPKTWSVDEIFELQSLENQVSQVSQVSIQRLKNFGYKYELDLNNEGTRGSVFSYDLREDKTAIQRICIGSRGAKKYLSIQGYGNSGMR